MTIFRIISALALLILLGAITFDLKLRLKEWKSVRMFLSDQMRNLILVAKEKKGLDTGTTAARIRSIVYASTLLCFLLLAVTGFVPILFVGDHLTGILLVIHVTVAPFFALSLSALGLLWAHALRFDGEEWRILHDIGKAGIGEETIRFASKMAFWLTLLLSLPLMLTVILELFPLFGTEGEEFLIRLHGYSALCLMLVAVTHLYCTRYPVQTNTQNHL
jgi:cytochrome b subunit of formate dehydrogenase